ncbi:cytochrome P450 3A8-like [Dermacentor andersoni]|uniref:cytochrome P450 3A8-like n=1 Tax=Dermacentor andersoni TaxID=34620 RepID=UPI003B3A868A
MVGEPELVKQMLVKDFPLLCNRRPLQFFDPILDNMMTIAPVERWRKIRPSASPAFTTGKLRRMNELIQACAEITPEHLKNAAQQKKDIDVKQFYGHYALDVIAKCAFGTKLDSHTDATNEFVTKARKAFSSGVTLPLLMLFLFPGLMKALKVKALNSEIFQYFKDVSVNIIQKRKDEHHRQEDFLQLMVDAQEGALHETAESTPGKEAAEIFNPNSEAKNDITFISKEEAEMAASALTITNPSTRIIITDSKTAINAYDTFKVSKEAGKILQGKEPSLDVVSKLPYLHCVVSEVLRTYPPESRVQYLQIIFVLERSAHEDYVLGDTGIRVPKGCVIGVPVYSMHHDPEFFPNPEMFDPDRFSEENVGSIRPYSYLPFGARPRNCIGIRFALHAMHAIKLSLLHSIHSVQLVLTEKTEVPLKFLPGVGIMNAKNVTVGIRERPGR